MKIKLAILDKDQNYLNRIVNVFETKYADKLQLYSFTDCDVAFATVQNEKIDVMLASDFFAVDLERLPKRCAFAFLVDSADVEIINEQRAVCKFQKADLIYKQVLSVYSENAGCSSGLRHDDGCGKVILFQPVSGGVGASSIAAACAINFASKGKRVLYLNFEHFGSSDIFFKAEGQFDMSDIVFALKSKKVNLAMKLESCVKMAESGVFFYSESKIALDMMELTSEDIIKLLTELRFVGSYDYIIVDTDFSIDRNALEIYRNVDTIVWIGDGSESSNSKLFRAYKSLDAVEQNEAVDFFDRMVIIYNKFSNKTGKLLTEIRITNIGGFPRIEHATSAQVLEQLSTKNIFDSIM